MSDTGIAGHTDDAFRHGALLYSGDDEYVETMERVGRNLARIIPAWRQFLGEHSGGRRSLHTTRGSRP